MTKYLGKIAVVGFLLGAGWFLLSQRTLWGFTVPFLTPTEQLSLQRGISSVQNAVGSQLGGITSAVAGQVNAVVQNTVSSVKTQAVDAVKTAVDNKINTIANAIGVNGPQVSGASTVTASAASPVVFSQQPGTQVYFTIKNTTSGSMTYTVDWKDGVTASGDIPQGTTKVISHAWMQQGSYLPEFTLTSVSGGARSYQVAISIL